MADPWTILRRRDIYWRQNRRTRWYGRSGESLRTLAQDDIGSKVTIYHGHDKNWCRLQSMYSSVIHKGHSFKIHKIMQNMHGGRKLKSRGSSFDWRDDLKNLFAIHFGGIWFRLCGCTKHKHIIMGPGAKVPNDTSWSTNANLHNLPTWEYGLSCGYYWGWVAESTSKRAAAFNSRSPTSEIVQHISECISIFNWDCNGLRVLLRLLDRERPWKHKMFIIV